MSYITEIQSVISVRPLWSDPLWSEKYDTAVDDGVDQWGKWGRVPSDNETIEIVGSKSPKAIAKYELERSFVPTGSNLGSWSDYPKWEMKGYENDIQYGEKWQGNFGVYSAPLTVLLFNVKPRISLLKIHAYKDFYPEKLTVMQYPFGKSEIELDLDKFKSFTSLWNNSLGALTGLLLKGPSGKINIDNEWKERNTHEVALAFHLKYTKGVEKNFFSANGKDIRIYPPKPGGNLLKFPPWIEKYLTDIGVYCTVKGSVGVEIDAYRDVDDLGELIAGGEAVGFGKITGEIFGKADIRALKFLIGANSGLTLKLGSVIDTSKIKVDANVKWDGMGYLGSYNLRMHGAL